MIQRDPGHFGSVTRTSIVEVNVKLGQRGATLGVYACELVEQCEGVLREAEFPITFIVLSVIGAMTVDHQTVETHDAGLHQGVQRVNE